MGRAVSVPCDLPTAAAFEMMAQSGLSGLALTHPHTGKLVGSISMSDMRGLTLRWFSYLALPVAEFVAASSTGEAGFRSAWEAQDRAPGAAEEEWEEVSG